jgi:hypothetical protein
MIILGVFSSTLPFKEVNTKNLNCNCRCKLLDVYPDTINNGKYSFVIQARCFHHILSWFKWKVLRKAVKGVKFKLDYKYSIMSDGTTRVIK